MKPFILLSLLFFLGTTMANAQPVAPVPSCACNNIASQFTLNKEEEKQTQKEIRQMDEDAKLMAKPASKSDILETKEKTHKWFWQR